MRIVSGVNSLFGSITLLRDGWNIYNKVEELPKISRCVFCKCPNDGKLVREEGENLRGSGHNRVYIECQTCKARGFSMLYLRSASESTIRKLEREAIENWNKVWDMVDSTRNQQ